MTKITSQAVMSAMDVVTAHNKLAFPRGFGDDLYWMECLANQSNRWVVRKCNIDHKLVQTLTPEGFAVSSKVHEYGGIAYGIGIGGLVWINKSDQGVYRSHNGENQCLFQDDEYFFGEPVVGANGVILIAERKQPDSLSLNMLVWLNWQGQISILHETSDFVAGAAFAPSGDRLVWMAWNMPHMPWQQGQVWTADWLGDGVVKNPKIVFEAKDVSVFQPDFTANGSVSFVQDQSGFGQINILDQSNPIGIEDAEYGLPLWQLGMRSYASLDDGSVVAVCAKEGLWQLVVHSDQQTLVKDVYGAHVQDPTAVGSGFAALVAPMDGAVQLRYWPNKDETEGQLIYASSDPQPLSWVVKPQSLWFEGAKGLVQGFFYCPKNGNSLPPVIIKSHGGPSGQTDPSLNMKHQFWLSRGYAIFDINYSGSTGFGRAYMNRLDHEWGVLDVSDCLAGVQFLIEQQKVHPKKAFISGSSAGGLTTLGCLCQSDVFAGGVCAYGVADLESLAQITHKFEARYLDRLVGVLPDQQAVYQARSPFHHAGDMRSPVLFLQGLQDVVVPPSQTEAMIKAIRAQPDAPEVSVVYFEDEGHGFRNSNNACQALEAEAEFYAKILSNQRSD